MFCTVAASGLCGPLDKVCPTGGLTGTAGLEPRPLLAELVCPLVVVEDETGTEGLAGRGCCLLSPTGGRPEAGTRGGGRDRFVDEDAAEVTGTGLGLAVPG